MYILDTTDIGLFGFFFTPCIIVFIVLWIDSSTNMPVELEWAQHVWLQMNGSWQADSAVQ